MIWNRFLPRYASQAGESAVTSLRGVNAWTSLHVAAHAGQFPCVQVLIDWGADTEAMTEIEGWTPLHLASQRGHAEVVQTSYRGHTGVMQGPCRCHTWDIQGSPGSCRVPTGGNRWSYRGHPEVMQESSRSHAEIMNAQLLSINLQCCIIPQHTILKSSTYVLEYS